MYIYLYCIDPHVKHNDMLEELNQHKFDKIHFYNLKKCLLKSCIKFFVPDAIVIYINHNNIMTKIKYINHNDIMTNIFDFNFISLSDPNPIKSLCQIIQIKCNSNLINFALKYHEQLIDYLDKILANPFICGNVYIDNFIENMIELSDYSINEIMNKIFLCEISLFQMTNSTHKLINNIKSNYVQLNNIKSNDTKSNNVQLNNIESNNTKSNNVQLNNIESNNTKLNDVQLNNIKSNDTKLNDVQLNNIKSNDTKSNDVQLNNIKSNVIKSNKTHQTQNNKLFCDKSDIVLIEFDPNIVQPNNIQIRYRNKKDKYWNNLTIDIETLIILIKYFGINASYKFSFLDYPPYKIVKLNYCGCFIYVKCEKY